MRIHLVFWIALGLLGISRVGSMLDAFAQYYQVRSLQTAIEASPPLRHQNDAPQDDLQGKMAHHFKDGIEGGMETFILCVIGVCYYTALKRTSVSASTIASS